MVNRINKIAFPLFIIWTFLICFCYQKNFSFPGGKDNVAFDEIACGIILVILCIIAGNRILKVFHLKDISTLDEMLFSAGIGLATLSTSIFALGLIQAFSPWALGSLLIGFGFIASTNYTYGRLLWNRARTWHPAPTVLELIIILIIFGFASLTLLNTLTPPLYRDALIHHLAIPKWYIRHHGIVDIPFSLFSYYPPLMEMLYAGALLLSSDIFAQLIHFLFYLGTLFVTYTLAKELLSRPMSLVAVLLFGSLPVVCQVSSIAYSDLGLTFFTVAGVLALFHWRKTRNQGWFYLGALMAGFAVGCKYNGLIVLFSLLTGVFFTLAQWKVPLKCLAKNIVLFLLLVFLVNSLWLGRNFWHTDNPVFPLASSFIGKNAFTNQPTFSPYERRKLLYGETLQDQILLPWTLSVMTKTKARHELDGVINPIFLVFLPFFLLLPKKIPEIKWIAYVSLLYFLFFWASSVVRLRYLLPIYPLLGIITAYAIAGWEIKWKKIFITFILSVAFLLNLYWVLRYTSTVNPINFLVGKESRQEFLCRHLPAYPVYEYANNNLPPTTRIMFLYGGNFGNDGYYLNRDYFFDSQYLGSTVKDILQKSFTPEEVRKELVRMGITHLLINWDLLTIDFSLSLPEEKLLLYKNFCKKFLHLEFKQGGSFLYRLQ
jgi:4-amino-4-deoxy-L-arabinose transferase-like glycosyltransferase